MVAAHVTCYGERPHIITCEGDVRIHIDGIKRRRLRAMVRKVIFATVGIPRLRPSAIRRAVMTG